MSLAVIVGDLHGDVITSGVERFGEVVLALNEAADHAITKGASYFICTGDVTDPGPRSYRMIAECIRIHERLDQQGIADVWVRGNHDLLDDGRSVLAPIAAAGGIVFDVPAFLPGKIGIVGLPYPDFGFDLDEWRAMVHDVLIRANESRNPVLVVGHLDVKGADHGSESRELARGRDVLWPTEKIRELCPRALMVGGHLHKAQSIEGVEIVGSVARFRHDEEDLTPSYIVLEVA